MESASETQNDPLLTPQIERLIATAQARHDDAIRPLLREIVPEYQAKRRDGNADLHDSHDSPDFSNSALLSLLSVKIKE